MICKQCGRKNDSFAEFCENCNCNLAEMSLSENDNIETLDNSTETTSIETLDNSTETTSTETLDNSTETTSTETLDNSTETTSTETLDTSTETTEDALIFEDVMTNSSNEDDKTDFINDLENKLKTTEYFSSSEQSQTLEPTNLNLVPDPIVDFNYNNELKTDFQTLSNDLPNNTILDKPKKKIFKNLNKMLFVILAFVLLGVGFYITTLMLSSNSNDGIFFLNEDNEYHFLSNLKESTDSFEIYDVSSTEKSTNAITDNNILYSLVTDYDDSKTSAFLYSFNLNDDKSQQIEIDNFRTTNYYSNSYIAETYGDDILFVVFDEIKYYDSENDTIIEIAEGILNIYSNEYKQNFFTKIDESTGLTTLYSINSSYKSVEIDYDIITLYTQEYYENSIVKPSLYYYKRGEMYSCDIETATSTLSYDILYDSDADSSSNHYSTIVDPFTYIVTYNENKSISEFINFDVLTEDILDEPIEPLFEDYFDMEVQDIHKDPTENSLTEDSTENSEIPDVDDEIGEETYDIYASDEYKEALALYLDDYVIYEEELSLYYLQSVFVELENYLLNDTSNYITTYYKDIYVDGELSLDKISSISSFYSNNSLYSTLIATAEHSPDVEINLSEILEEINLSQTTERIASSVTNYISNIVFESQLDATEQTYLVSKNISLTSYSALMFEEDYDIFSMDYYNNNLYISARVNDNIEITAYSIRDDKTLASPVVIFDNSASSIKIIKDPYTLDIYIIANNSSDSMLYLVADGASTVISKSMNHVRFYETGEIFVLSDKTITSDLYYYGVNQDYYTSFTLYSVVDGSTERIARDISAFELLSDKSYLILSALEISSSGKLRGADLIKITADDEIDIEFEVISFTSLDSINNYIQY